MESELYSRKVMIASMAAYIINRMNAQSLNVVYLDINDKVTYSKFIGDNKAYHITPYMVERKDDGNIVIRATEAVEREDGYLGQEEVEVPLNGENEFQFQILSDIINEIDVTYGRYFTIGYLCNDGCFSTIIKEKKSLMFENYQDAEKYMKKIQPKYKHKLEIKRL